MTRRLSRRECLRATAATTLGLTILPAHLVRGYTANEKINIGVIGVGGQGGGNLNAVSGENIVALCDCDRRPLEGAAGRFPAARKYTDYRKLLDEARDLDAVVVSTPDHHHAPACIPAMRMGLHCYCEKPLTRDVAEARQMAEVAVAKRLSTHMGTSSRAGENTIRQAEIMRSGAIGDVVEAHYWTDRPIWPQGFDRPAGEDPIPDYLDWDSFIGSAPMRPHKNLWPEGHAVYSSRWGHRQVYHPFVWRGWWDFGTGALGDIAPHMWSPVYWGLELRAPRQVEIVDMSGPVTEMFPEAATLCFTFPVGDGRPEVKVYWYDGGHRPGPEKVGTGEIPDNGQLIVGTRGSIGVGHQSVDDFPDVPRTLRRYGNIHEDWLAGIRDSDPDRPSCPFSYAGPLTEAYLLGNIALKMERTLIWDADAFQFTNCPEANQYLHRDYRPGWNP